MGRPTEQEIKDLRDAPKLEDAYNKADKTPPAPKTVTPKKSETKAFDAEDMGYKKGGMTASSRADGIAQRGKTRGTIC